MGIGGSCRGSTAARAWSRPFTSIQYRNEECWKLVRIVEQFWWSFPLQGPSDVHLFLGQPHKFAKPRNTKPRKERDKCTRKITRLDGTRMFVTVFTRVCPLQISRATGISSTHTVTPFSVPRFINVLPSAFTKTRGAYLLLKNLFFLYRFKVNLFISC
jgi:hypothetical protein